MGMANASGALDRFSWLLKKQTETSIFRFGVYHFPVTTFECLV